VVATGLESVRSYLAGDEGVLVDRNTPDVLAGALDWLRGDAAARARMAARARASAERLSWPGIAARIAALYESLS
jgi:glycosyltransferase involved in cell wall biosynthesis